MLCLCETGSHLQFSDIALAQQNENVSIFFCLSYIGLVHTYIYAYAHGYACAYDTV